MTMFRRLILSTVALLALAVPLHAQTALLSTTISAAITTTGQSRLSLASTTSLAVGDYVFVDREAMKVINLTPLTVTRGVNSKAAPHATGSLAYYGSPDKFANDVFAGGACTRANEKFLPRVVLPIGDVWDCAVGAGIWTRMNPGLVETAKSTWFNLDNGAGTTVDDVIIRPARPIVITAARIVYVDATAGTVAAGNAKIGTTVGAADIVAATAYTNSAAVGATTAMVVLAGQVAAGTPVFVRHTGIAATVAGQAYVEIDFVYR